MGMQATGDTKLNWLRPPKLLGDDDSSSSPNPTRTMSASSPAQKQPLFDDDDSSSNEEIDTVQVNKKYAKEYERRKQRQELLFHKQRGGGDDSDDDDDSSSSDEDDEAELLSTQVDVDVFKTINALRAKDDRIYDPTVRFFDDASDDEEEDDGDPSSETKKIKPKRVKDVIREQTLEDMEKGEAMDEEDVGPHKSTTRSSRFAYDAEQEAFRRDLVAASGHDEDDEVVVPKRKDKKEEEREQRELLEELEKLEATKDEKNPLVDPKGEVKDGESFLLDFFKNKPWKLHVESEEESDNDEEEHVVPMKPPSRGTNNEDDDVSLDELDKTDEFEAQYNFRFEETASSGATHSLRNYSRNNIDTLRRKDDRRKEKRLAKQERKAAERKQKEEQLKRLKNAKRQEMEEKLGQIKSVVGQHKTMDEAAIMKLLEGDFDPDKFAEIMQETYDDSFYEQEDEEWENDRAVRESLKAELGPEQVDDVNGDLYDEDEHHEDEYDDADGHREEEYNEDEWNAEEQGEEAKQEETELDKKLRKKIEDELYKLDYEDIVAGMPTRFKYRQVEPNSYGLTTEEILLARDTTLKEFVSLKKLAPYSEQEYRVTGRKRRKFREALKSEVEEMKELEEKSEPKKKKSRRLRKAKRKGKDVSTSEADIAKENDEQETSMDVDEVEPRGDEKPRGRDGNCSSLQDTPDPTPASKDTHKSESKAAKSTKASDKVLPVEPEVLPKADASEKQAKKKKRKRKRKEKVDGVSSSRLASYGL